MQCSASDDHRPSASSHQTRLSAHQEVRCVHRSTPGRKQVSPDTRCRMRLYSAGEIHTFRSLATASGPG
jgi:hypothetical protein